MCPIFRVLIKNYAWELSSDRTECCHWKHGGVWETFSCLPVWSDKDVACLANRFILDVLLKGPGRWVSLWQGLMWIRVEILVYCLNDVFQPRFCFSGVFMSNNKKTQASYVKPSRADIVRSVATSTAVETGQSSAKIEASLEAARKKFAHLRLA